MYLIQKSKGTRIFGLLLVSSAIRHMTKIFFCEKKFNFQHAKERFQFFSYEEKVLDSILHDVQHKCIHFMKIVNCWNNKYIEVDVDHFNGGKKKFAKKY